MAEDNGMALGYALGQDSSNNSGGMFNGDGFWGIILLALLFGGNGWGGGFGGFGGGGAMLNGALTRAELYDGFAIQNIDSAVRGVQQGICDSTYALNNAITSGFYGVDRSICDVSHQISDCCCQTQRAIDGVNYNMATQFCALGNTIQSGIRDVIDNQNAGMREIMNFMVSEKLASKDARIAELSRMQYFARQSTQALRRSSAAPVTSALSPRMSSLIPTAAMATLWVWAITAMATVAAAVVVAANVLLEPTNQQSPITGEISGRREILPPLTTKGEKLCLAKMCASSATVW